MTPWHKFLPAAWSNFGNRSPARAQARNTATRWSVWLGANTARRLAISRGITLGQAHYLLSAGEHDGVLVRVGTVRGRGLPAIQYATPDPTEYP